MCELTGYRYLDTAQMKHFVGFVVGIARARVCVCVYVCVCVCVCVLLL